MQLFLSVISFIIIFSILLVLQNVGIAVAEVRKLGSVVGVVSGGHTVLIEVVVLETLGLEIPVHPFLELQSLVEVVNFGCLAKVSKEGRAITGVR